MAPVSEDTIIFEPAYERVRAGVEQSKDSPMLLWCKIGSHRWHVIGRRLGHVQIQACSRCGKVREGMMM